MPLFSTKFSPKKIPPRKVVSLSTLQRDLDPLQTQQEFGANYGPIRMKLGDQETVFENGNWSSSGVSSSKDVSKLKQQNKQLLEENNMLKLKIEILMDMLVETTAEFHLQDSELEELKELLITNRK